MDSKQFKENELVVFIGKAPDGEIYSVEVGKIKRIWENKLINLEDCAPYKYLNGDKVIYREHVKTGNAVIILPITDDNQIIMIQEPRTPIGKVILDLPAGVIEKGEDAEKAAIRELEEETGYLASKVEFLREYYQTVGYSDEKIKIYLVRQ